MAKPLHYGEPAFYVVRINVPGYLPQDDEPPTFETAKAAWEYLRDERERDEDSAETDGDDYSETHKRLSEIAALLDAQSEQITHYINDDGTGTVYGDTPGSDSPHDLGIAYGVLLVYHVDYPHEPGRLFDCEGCESGPCTCNPETDAPCVSPECIQGE